MIAEGLPWNEAKGTLLSKIDFGREIIDKNETILLDALDKHGEEAEFALTSSFKHFFMTPFYWRCPSCKRKKSEIIRTDCHGKLMTHLVRHHDHCEDGARAYFERKLAKCDDPALLKAWFERMIEAFRRFKPTIICQDCNTVDVTAKRFVGASRYFSFSPDELALVFVLDEDGIPRADRDLALTAFLAAHDEFLELCAIGKRLIRRRFEFHTFQKEIYE